MAKAFGLIRLTKVADYGIVLLSYVAHELPGERFNARGLAEDTRIPAPMVSKILKSLAKNDLLRSHRGVKGGYSLARSADEITVADVIRALDGPIALTECIEMSESDCSIDLVCPIKSNWQRINDAVIGSLEGIKISEMAPPNAEKRLRIEVPKKNKETAVAT